MAFGNRVTTYTASAIGTYGYIIKLDLEADTIAQDPFLIYKINGVQAQTTSPTYTPAGVYSEVSYDTLQDYLEDSGCPDLAFHQNGVDLLIFFKTSVFPYTATTYFALFYYRNPMKCTATSDKLDIPDRDIELLKDYVLAEAYQNSKRNVPLYLYDEINELEIKIKAE